MLKSVYIENLFGLYTYTLDMKPESNKAIRFITGPNGYGKTTILNILDRLFNWDLKSLSQNVFDIVRLTFEDGVIFNVRQSRNYESDDQYSDEKNISGVGLDIDYCSGTLDNVVSSVKWNTGDTEYDASTGLLYLLSHPVYHIRDNRLQKADSALTVLDNADDLREILEQAAVMINSSIVVKNYSPSDFIGEEKYESVRNQLEGDLDVLLSCGLVEENPLPEYNKDNAGYLKALSENVCSSVNEPYIHKLIGLLKCFIDLVERSDFAGKHMQINPTDGYRFILDDEKKTILLADSLSSGEQHTLIMVYELLFKVPEYSLVLLDEPELSFHLIWQMYFLKNLREIVSLRKGLQCIVCTHAPRMFDGDFNLTVDLYVQSKETESK